MYSFTFSLSFLKPFLKKHDNKFIWISNQNTDLQRYLCKTKRIGPFKWNGLKSTQSLYAASLFVYFVRGTASHCKNVYFFLTVKRGKKPSTLCSALHDKFQVPCSQLSCKELRTDNDIDRESLLLKGEHCNISGSSHFQTQPPKFCPCKMVIDARF